MLPNIAKLQPMLERMTGPQLQQFAAMHHDDAVAVGLAMQIDKSRKEEVSRLQALMSGQKQPTVIDQAMQALGNPQQQMQGGPQGGAPMPPPGGPQGQMPPQGMPPQGPPGMQMPPQAPPAPQGVAALPAPNMEGMADGGIAGYADEDEAVGYADGGVVHMAGGGLDEDAIRAQGRSLGLDDAAIDRFIAGRKAQAPQRELPFTPAATSAVSMFRDPGYDVFKNPPTTRQLYGDQPTLGTAADAIEEMTRKNAVKDLFARPGMQQFVTDLEAGRVRPSAEEPGKVLPMTPGQGALNVPTAEQVSTALAARKSAPPQPPATPRTGASTGPTAPQPPAAPAYTDKPVSSYIPFRKDVPMTQEEAQQEAGEYSIFPLYKQGATALLESGKIRDEKLRALQKTAPGEEIGKKTDEYIKEARKELEAEKKDRGAHFLISAGLAIASGTSPRAMQNIAQGLQVGVKDAKDAMKDFKAAQKELIRMEADLENARIAQKERRFDRMFSFEQSAAERDERRQQHALDGAITLAQGDKKMAYDILSASRAEANNWARFGATALFGRDERLSGQAATKEENAAQREFQARENAANRANQRAVASMPSGQLQLLSILGGAKFGEAPTQAQLNAGLNTYSSINDAETALLAYDKLKTERAKAMASNPMVQLDPLPDQNTWMRQFMQQKRAYSLYTQGAAGGIPTTTTPGKAPVYGR
jgi:hypothetical protein